MKSKLKATLKVFVRIGISVILLGWLISRSDPTELLNALLDISPVTWSIAFLMYILSQIISSARWHILARALGFPGKWRTYLGYYFVGMYFNLFLPTGVGGDFLKVMFLTKETPRRIAATYSVIADRLFGLAAMFLLGAGAVFIWQNLLPARFELILKVSGIAALTGPVFLIFVSRFLKKSWPALGKKLATFLIFFEQPYYLVMALLLSLALQALGMGALALLAWDMNLSPPAPFYFAAFPLVALLVILPISFNGIGVREGGFIYFLGLRGISSEKALTLSLSFFAIQVVASLLGGIAYTLGFHKRPLTDSVEKKG